MILVTVSMAGNNSFHKNTQYNVQEDLNTQETLTIAQECDPAERRIMGALMFSIESSNYVQLSLQESTAYRNRNGYLGLIV